MTATTGDVMCPLCELDLGAEADLEWQRRRDGAWEQVHRVCQDLARQDAARAATDTLWTRVLAARRAAHAKHGENSIERMTPEHPRWLAVLVEEVGEVAEALTYDRGTGPEHLRDELIDVLAVASAWVDAIETRLAADDVVDDVDACQDCGTGPCHVCGRAS